MVIKMSAYQRMFKSVHMYIVAKEIDPPYKKNKKKLDGIGL